MKTFVQISITIGIALFMLFLFAVNPLLGILGYFVYLFLVCGW